MQPNILILRHPAKGAFVFGKILGEHRLISSERHVKLREVSILIRIFQTRIPHIGSLNPTDYLPKLSPTIGPFIPGPQNQMHQGP
jgi:hypothetical protein